MSGAERSLSMPPATTSMLLTLARRATRIVGKGLPKVASHVYCRAKVLTRTWQCLQRVT